MNAQEKLRDAFVAAGLPVGGICVLETGRATEPGWQVLTQTASGKRVRVDFTSGPSAAQLVTAQTVLDAWDRRGTIPRTESTISAAILALTTADRNKVFAGCAARLAVLDDKFRAYLKSEVPLLVTEDPGPVDG